MRRAAAVLAVAVVATTACLGSPTGITISGTGRRILFIGNSHTYVNDVPGLVQALAAAAGPEPIAVASNAPPNFALIDHVNGTARRQITGGQWSVVVLQQGWTPAGACRDTLRLAVRQLAADAEKAGARVALYQVWAPTNRPSHMPGTIRSYELAAEDVKGVLYPAAAAFRIALERDPNLPLYLDGMHASREGSYLVALVIYATLFDRSPVGLPTSLTTLSGDRMVISPAIAATLQEAAADVTVRKLGGSNGADGPVIANPGTC